MHRNSPVSPLLRAINQLNKGVTKIGHKSVLIQQEMAGLHKAVEIATEVKGQKRKYIQTAETLTVREIANLIAKKEGGGQKEGRESSKRVRTQRHCRRCRETSHNTHTCTVEIVDASNSNKSE
jgi:hypothetical protein